MKALTFILFLMISCALSSPANARMCKRPTIDKIALMKADYVFSGILKSTSKAANHWTKQEITVIENIYGAVDGETITIYSNEEYNPNKDIKKRGMFVVLGKPKRIEYLKKDVYIAPLCNNTQHYEQTLKNAIFLSAKHDITEY